VIEELLKSFPRTLSGHAELRSNHTPRHARAVRSQCCRLESTVGFTACCRGGAKLSQGRDIGDRILQVCRPVESGDDRRSLNLGEVLGRF
jgi:hypothetical protein